MDKKYVIINVFPFFFSITIFRTMQVNIIEFHCVKMSIKTVSSETWNSAEKSIRQMHIQTHAYRCTHSSMDDPHLSHLFTLAKKICLSASKIRFHLENVSGLRYIHWQRKIIKKSILDIVHCECRMMCTVHIHFENVTFISYWRED